jgi:general secretion pathway protein G
MHSSTPPRGPQRGFTLIELMVVLAILGLLAGLVGPRVLSQLGGAKSKTAAVQIADLDKSLELFKLDTGRYPTTDEGLQALVVRPGALAGWAGPYLKGSGVPADPWGNAYRYAAANGRIELQSFGGDGAPGGEGEAADIRNVP